MPPQPLAPSPTLEDARSALSAAEALTRQAVLRTREITKAGDAIDDHQVLSERVAYAATETRAARELVEYAGGAQREGRGNRSLEMIAAATAADLAVSVRSRLEPALE